LVILKAVVVGAALALTLLLSLRWSGRPWLAALVTALAALAGRYFWDIRPQMFTYLFLALFLLLIDDFRSRGRTASLWPLAPLTGLWANLHGGFVLGPLVLGAYLLGDALDYLVRGHRHRGRSALLTLPLAGGVLLSLLNPNGYHLWLYPIRLTEHPDVLSFVVEWFSPDFHNAGYRLFELMLLLLLPAFLWGRERYATADLLLMAGAVHYSLYSARHVPIYLLLAAPVLARYFGGALDRLRDLSQEQPREAESGKSDEEPGVGAVAKPGFGMRLYSRMKLRMEMRWLLPAVIGVGCLFLAAWHIRPVIGKAPFNHAIAAASFPSGAVEFLRRESPPGPIWNEYRWGGYLIWHLPERPVFIDGRAEVYYGGAFEDFIEIHRVRRNWQELLDRRGVQVVLVDTWALLARAMEASPSWRAAYSDPVATVFVRTSETRWVSGR
jgi:hypothetical protein